MKSWRIPVLTGVIVTMLVHLLLVSALPTMIMGLAETRIRENARQTIRSMGLDPDKIELANLALHAPPISVENREVVSPSPNLLYTAVLYDVEKSPIRIEVPIPDTYWSISFFGSNTDNFFVMNDRQVAENPARFVLARPSDTGPFPEGAVVVRAASDRGLILFRSLIKNQKQMEQMILQREQTQIERIK